jgi:hypothetical protein
MALPGAATVQARRPARPEGRFTWRADFAERALDRSEARIRAAVVDAADDLVLAGSAVGPLLLEGEAEFSDDHHERAFIAKIDRTGRVRWVRSLGSVPSSGVLTELGITALAAIGDELVAAANGDLSWMDGKGRVRRSAPLELPPVLSIVAAPDRDLYVGGCLRQWRPAPAPGLSPVSIQTGGFLARVSPAGEVRWRRLIREAGANLPRKGVAIGPLMDCVTQLLPSRDGGVTAGGMFNGPFSIGRAPLGSDSGTFLARFSSRGEVEWAQAVAVRLATVSYDVRPQFGVLPSGSLVGSGIVPTGVPPGAASGMRGVSADGRVEWSRVIRSGSGCCNIDSPLATASRKALVVAGIAPFGEAVEVDERRLIEHASSNAFVLWLGRDGAPSRGRALHESATELSAAVVGRGGVWIVGTHHHGAPGTGIFADWIPE